MYYSVRKIGNAVVIEMKGTLMGNEESQKFQKTLSEWIQMGDTLFLLDLGSLEFMDSSGIGMLLACQGKVNKASGQIILVNVPDQVRESLKLANLEGAFTTVDNIEEGLKYTSE